MYKLAIVIPYYKIDFFDETLKSLALQECKDFTVYIGDDASPNSPDFLIEKYRNDLDFRFVRFNSNLGGKSLVKQWDRCLENVEEEWFVILGDDDCFAPNVVKSFYDHYKKFIHHSNVIRFASQLIDESNEKISSIQVNPEFENPLDSYCKKLIGEVRSSLSEYFFKTINYRKLGFKDYNLAWGTDDRAVIDFALNKPIYSIPSLVFVRMSQLNISSQKNDFDHKIPARLKCIKEIYIDYKNELTKENRKLLFHSFEHQFYRNKSMKILDIILLIRDSFIWEGFYYSLKQMKSIFNKMFINNS